jgi:hypothetical protein
MVSHSDDSRNTLQIELIYLHSKLSELGFTYVGGKVVYPELKSHDV